MKASYLLSVIGKMIQEGYDPDLWVVVENCAYHHFYIRHFIQATGQPDACKFHIFCYKDKKYFICSKCHKKCEEEVRDQISCQNCFKSFLRWLNEP